MKVNLPVTDVEHELREGQTIVSHTDLMGIITYANRDLIGICGFSKEELIGQSHNIMCHSDMPPAAFADLWSTIKSGRPWRGIVKNRCKNGDFYWVSAVVTPLKENGKQLATSRCALNPYAPKSRKRRSCTRPWSKERTSNPAIQTRSIHHV